MIGTLPWVVNPPGIAAASPVPAPSLQEQAVTPQLLLNAQGQVIATLASGTIQATAIKKSGPPEPPTKSEVSWGRAAWGQREHPRDVAWPRRDSFPSWDGDARCPRLALVPATPKPPRGASPPPCTW